MKRTLTIAIPTWNNARLLNTTLNTLIGYTEFPYKIVVVDNGSDPTLAAMAEGWPDFVEYLDPGSNLGWMGGINYALDRCDTPFFCMMNDDVVFPQGSAAFWRSLMRHFGDPAVGLVGPSSDFISGLQSIRALTPTIFETTYAIGVCLVMRADFLRELGGLDESLPGGDDIDLSIRVRKAGKSIRIDKGAFLHHEGQQSGPRKQGAYYDSLEHQEVVRNALIRKHGVRTQWEAYSLEIWPTKMQVEDSVETDHAWMEARAKGHGIDVGCGSNPIKGAIGVDQRAPGELGAGGQKFQPVAEGTVQAEADDLPFEDGELDYVVASHVLEHLVDPIAALREWQRVLRTEGRLLIGCPDHGVLDTMVIDHTHVHAFTLNSLENLLMLCGFAIVESEKTPWGNLRVEAVR